jgi:hypothetical protein
VLRNEAGREAEALGDEIGGCAVAYRGVLSAPGRPIKPTSIRCPSAWQPNFGRRSTYRRGKSVQTFDIKAGASQTPKRARPHASKRNSSSAAGIDEEVGSGLY